MIQIVLNIAQARLRDYLDNITRTDLSRVSGIKRNPQLIARLLASLARNEATTASCATLIEDIASEDGSSLARSTIRAYLDELTRLFVLEPLPAWATHLRSSARLRKSS